MANSGKGEGKSEANGKGSPAKEAKCPPRHRKAG
jgi:hypothetical protein